MKTVKNVEKNDWEMMNDNDSIDLYFRTTVQDIEQRFPLA